MKFLPLLLASAFATLPALAQRDMTLNVDSVLREIDALEEKQKQAVAGARANAFDTMLDAAKGGSAASGLYADAVEATQFQGRQDRVPAFVDWKKKNSDLLGSSEFQSAVAMHLRYLLLTMDRQESEDAERFAGPSFDYARDLAEVLQAVDELEKPAKELKEILDRPLKTSIFAKWLSLDPWLYSGDDWESVPGNLEGILAKNVRVPWRNAGNRKIIESHDFQIQFEADLVASGRLEHAVETYQSIRRPNLVFARANDIAALGFPQNAANEILVLARNTPQHPDFSKWLDRIRELLAKPDATKTAPSSTPAAP